MKILILYQDLDSGARLATEQIADAMRADTSHMVIKYAQPTGVYQGKLAFLKNLVWSLSDFQHEISMHQVECIYTNMYTAVIAAARCSPQTPVIFHIHGDQSHQLAPFKPYQLIQYLYASSVKWLVSHLQRTACELADRLIFVSKASEKQFQNMYPTLPIRQKSQVIYNGVDPATFRPAKEARKQNLRKKYHLIKGLVISYLGRLDEKKGIHSLISSLHHFSQPVAALLIAYTSFPDRYTDVYWRQLTSLSSQSKTPVIFLERPQEVAEIYQLSDCVVLPSSAEMLPLTMLEALACGVPFVGTRVGGIPEVMRQVDPEALLDQPTPRQIAQRVQFVLARSKSVRTQVKQRGIKLTKKMSWQIVADQVIGVMRTLTLVK